ncbi:MAG: GH3 auxin-responsive promoter family protein [Alphaproteobacteria bacterium]
MIDVTRPARFLARRRLAHLAALDPAESQRRTLRALVGHAAGTRFGRDHGFARIRTPEDFRAAVPLRRWEDMWQAYWRAAFPVLDNVSWPGRVPFFAVTSGTTTGRTKHIPVTRAMNRSNRSAAFELLAHHLGARPASRLGGGRMFMLGGSARLERLAPGVRAGDLSGIAAATAPRIGRPWFFPPPALAVEDDWERKIDGVARIAREAHLRLVGGVPSWLLALFDRMAALEGDDAPRLPRLLPELEMIVHGGVHFAPYRERFARLLEGSHAELREVYAASEGFVAIADRGSGEGMLLGLERGLYFEFVPVGELDAPQPTRHWIGEVERGVEYAIVLSTCAGLWGHVLGDTVRFVDRAPPRLLVTGRTSYMLSAFGEHLIDAELEEAVSAAAAAIGALVTDWSVAPRFPEGSGERGHHLFVVEFGAPPSREAEARFLSVLDAALAETNDDYRAHRSANVGIEAPRLTVAAPGAFAAWMKARGQLGGQHKVPRIVNDAALFAGLLDHVAMHASRGNPTPD